ncbi:MAG TPA: DUF2252 domain-containing protein [Candidatus Angelobacter sp.]|nr:DUF2252 domain-containing protein [Candidatus Angelobacter sp.]
MASRAVSRPARSHQAGSSAPRKLTLVPRVPRSRDERYAAGKALRQRLPREQHGEWTPSRRRRDPVELVIESSKGRIPDLIPIRYGRMMVSPFTFYRGTANLMAADLAPTPVTGLHVQLCGDAHLLNFGGFATPERRLLLDINDLDETLPGPWEWDLKRLAASFVFAARSNGFSPADQREAALACVRSYREHMAEYGDMPVLDVWYARLQLSDVMTSLHDKATRGRLKKQIKKAATRAVPEHEFPKLAEAHGARFAIKDVPPLIYHHPHINDSRENLERGLDQYRKSLTPERQLLLNRYQLMDFALKVVGVGSVGTLCAVALMMAADDDPLFLQIKEAGPSVLEASVGKSRYANHGQRVVEGQRLMQAASDLFLGWTHGQAGRHFYIRQLRDMKIKPLVELFNPTTMFDYAMMCGWTLARAHARSGDPAMMAGYMGKSDVFDQAIAAFSKAYADQAEQDHAVFKGAIRQGRIEAQTEN